MLFKSLGMLIARPYLLNKMWLGDKGGKSQYNAQQKEDAHWNVVNKFHVEYVFLFRDAVNVSKITTG